MPGMYKTSPTCSNLAPCAFGLGATTSTSSPLAFKALARLKHEVETPLTYGG